MSQTAEIEFDEIPLFPCFFIPKEGRHHYEGRISGVVTVSRADDGWQVDRIRLATTQRNGFGLTFEGVLRDFDRTAKGYDLICSAIEEACTEEIDAALGIRRRPPDTTLNHRQTGVRAGYRGL